MFLNPNCRMVQCPYEIHHKVRIDRLQYHLVKCRKNHPDSDFVICPFNASHHVPKKCEESHTKTCPDRMSIEVDYNGQQSKQSSFSNQNKCRNFGSSNIPFEEDPDFPVTSINDSQASSIFSSDVKLLSTLPKKENQKRTDFLLVASEARPDTSSNTRTPQDNSQSYRNEFDATQKFNRVIEKPEQKREQYIKKTDIRHSGTKQVDSIRETRYQISSSETEAELDGGYHIKSKVPDRQLGSFNSVDSIRISDPSNVGYYTNNRNPLNVDWESGYGRGTATRTNKIFQRRPGDNKSSDAILTNPDSSFQMAEDGGFEYDNKTEVITASAYSNNVPLTNIKNLNICEIVTDNPNEISGQTSSINSQTSLKNVDDKFYQTDRDRCEDNRTKSTSNISSAQSQYKSIGEVLARQTSESEIGSSYKKRENDGVPDGTFPKWEMFGRNQTPDLSKSEMPFDCSQLMGMKNTKESSRASPFPQEKVSNFEIRASTENTSYIRSFGTSKINDPFENATSKDSESASSSSSVCSSMSDQGKLPPGGRRSVASRGRGRAELLKRIQENRRQV